MLEQIFLHQKQYSLNLRRRGAEFRLEILQTLEELILNSQDEIVAALIEDLHKPEVETLLTEIQPVLDELHLCQKHLEQWMRPQPMPGSAGVLGPAQSFIHFEPKGVCLIIASWNCPFQLAFLPLVGALAAGNCVVLQPSELAPATSHLIATMLKSQFAEEHVRVIEGGSELSEKLLSLPFDHIFFAGSSQAGRRVMAAASKHLSSITLELGGKSPALVDNSASLELAAEKIAWGKLLNAGQTCVAPDYIFVHEEVAHEFMELLKSKLDELHGPSEAPCHGFTRIVSRHHFERLEKLLEDALEKGAHIAWGGCHNKQTLNFTPTVLTEVHPHSQLMKEEIFGPLLPVFVYKELNEVIHFINDQPRPLALYVFSLSDITIHRMTLETSSGGICINDMALQQISPGLPFGGVGESGQGNYHGYYSFRAFSHEKPVLQQGWLSRFLRPHYPPYTAFKTQILKKMMHWH